MQIIVTDLCGRSDLQIVNLADAADALGLTREDIEFIEDRIDECGIAFIGEIEYRAA